MANDMQKYTQDEFSELFLKYWGKIYTICYRYTSDADTAKDMVQNIFITLWERDLPIRDNTSLEKYLTKAAKYQVFKNARNIKINTTESLDKLDNYAIDNVYSPHQQYIFRELSTELDKQVSLLKEPARTIFRLSRYESLSHKEIAIRLGIAVKTVEYHLTRSIRFLRNNYK